MTTHDYTRLRAAVVALKVIADGMYSRVPPISENPIGRVLGVSGMRSDCSSLDRIVADIRLGLEKAEP